MKSLLLLTACLSISGCIAAAGPLEVRQAQTMLNQLGYKAGSVDGIAGKNTNRAMQDFMTSVGRTFDGSIDSEEVALLSDATGTVIGPYRYRDAFTAQENLPLYYTAKGGTYFGGDIDTTCFIHFSRDQFRWYPVRSEIHDWDEMRASCFVGSTYDAYPQEFLDLTETVFGTRL